MTKGKNVVVTDESESGLNRRFRDQRTGHEMTRGQFADAIERDQYPDYHVQKLPDGRRIPRSNPNGSDKDNLG